LPTAKNSAIRPAMDTTRSGARPVVRPLNGQPPAVMGWATADTQTDSSLISVGSADDESFNGSVEPFDQDFLNESVVPSSDMPTPRGDLLDRTDWPTWILVLGVLAGVVVLLGWLVHMAEKVWSSLL